MSSGCQKWRTLSRLPDTEELKIFYGKLCTDAFSFTHFPLRASLNSYVISSPCPLMFRQASLAPSPIMRFSMCCYFPSQQNSYLSGSSGGPGFHLFPKYTHLTASAISRGLLERMGMAVRCKCLLSLLEAVLNWRNIARYLVDYIARVASNFNSSVMLQYYHKT